VISTESVVFLIFRSPNLDVGVPDTPSTPAYGIIAMTSIMLSLYFGVMITDRPKFTDVVLVVLGEVVRVAETS
tara:strand:+ start:239 stop:457 length:219 start_codon:yes stop_codon:yes gene_type:complete